MTTKILENSFIKTSFCLDVIIATVWNLLANFEMKKFDFLLLYYYFTTH